MLWRRSEYWVLRLIVTAVVALLVSVGAESHAATPSPVRTPSPVEESVPVLPAWAAPVSSANLSVIGMQPTEIVDWTLLREQTEIGSPIAVVFAKATTTAGETTLDEVLATKYSIGIYIFDRQIRRWYPVWERITGQLGVDFVEGYDILDVNGDGFDEVCVKIRYYGAGRALDYVVKAVNHGKVKAIFQEKSLYRGSVTAATGYIVVDQQMTDPSGLLKTEVYAWQAATRMFQKVREIRNKVDE